MNDPEPPPGPPGGAPGGAPGAVDPRREEAIRALCDVAFGVGVVGFGPPTDVNRGRGAFSDVVRVELRWPTGGTSEPEREPAATTDPDRPRSVVAKLPVAGPNGVAAAGMGAYRREALAYRHLLAGAPIAVPRAHAVLEAGDGTCSLLLEDLTGHRQPDQLAGLEPDDAIRVARALARFHRSWDDPDRLSGLGVRRDTVAGLPAPSLATGLEALAERWAGAVGPEDRAVFARLVAAQDGAARRFAAAPRTLCHGDPRADNLVFDADDRPVLYDWQQLAVQFGEADLAWLAATSLDVETRRRIEPDLVGAAGGDRDRYRIGLALPGLAVLLLAQRDLPTDRARRYVAVSLRRIASALADNGTVELAETG